MNNKMNNANKLKSYFINILTINWNKEKKKERKPKEQEKYNTSPQ